MSLEKFRADAKKFSEETATMWTVAINRQGGFRIRFADPYSWGGFSSETPVEAWIGGKCVYTNEGVE